MIEVLVKVFMQNPFIRGWVNKANTTLVLMRIGGNSHA